MKTTRRRLADAYAALEKLAQYSRSVKLSYQIAKCRAALRPEIEALQEASKPSREYLEFERRRIAACEAHAVRGPDGKPLLTEDGATYVIEDPVELNATVEVFRGQHAPAIAAREAQMVALDALMAEQVDPDLPQISIDMLSDETLSGAPSLALLLEPLLGLVVVETR